MNGDDASFRVDDRRRFDPETGEPRVESETGEVPLPGGGVLQPHDEDSSVEAETELPIRFDDLVRPFMLMALAGLGVVPDPESEKPRVNLVTARAGIEMLELLEKKTAGNLEPEEMKLIEQALFELKMNFVELRKGKTEE